MKKNQSNYSTKCANRHDFFTIKVKEIVCSHKQSTLKTPFSTHVFITPNNKIAHIHQSKTTAIQI